MISILKLDFLVFYLDDGTIAGQAEAVHLFCEMFQQEMAGIGLTLSVSKCEVVPSAGSNFAFVPDLFPGWTWRTNGCFKMLGTPFGDAKFCEAHSAKRAAKAEALLSGISDYDHTQGGLLLLRHCASWCKLVYSARTVPPVLHRSALSEFGARLRIALEHLAGGKLPERSWRLAQLAVIQGGLGIRDPVRHAASAYLASFLASRDLCCCIDPHFDPGDRDGGSHRAVTESELRDNMLEAASWDHGGAAPSQKELSNLLDAAALQK